MGPILAGTRSRVAALHALQYHAQVRLRKQTCSLVRDFQVRAGLRLGKWIDVRSPAAEKHMDIRVLHGAAEFKPVDEELRQFLRTQTTVPVRDGFVGCGAIPVCFLKNAKLHVSPGTVCTHDNTLLLEAPWEIGRLKSSPTYGARFPANPRFLQGTYSTIWGNWTDNYYHWLIEYLPRLHSLRCATANPSSCSCRQP